MAELKKLMEDEIPKGRKQLLESYENLQKVSAYCSQRYLDDPDKKKVLEETKGFTTQSLASVAYQINQLSSSMLNMLDIHAVQLANMESSLNVITQTVDIHKEKVARREIGLLTANKSISRNARIMYPNIPDRAVKYIRKPIDFSECDDIGHGIKLGNRSDSNTLRRHSTSKKPSSPSTNRISADVSKGGYGTLRAVKAPRVPLDFNHSPQISASRHRTNSNSSSGSSSLCSGSSQIPYGIPNPPTVPSIYTPSLPDNLPVPPVASNIPPPPPPAAAVIPPPPSILNIASPVMCPPPPPLTVSQEASFKATEVDYSTPVLGKNRQADSVKDNADSYATTSVMDLPPPPPVSHDLLASADTHISQPTDASVLPPPPSMMVSDKDSWIPDQYEKKMIVIYDYTAMNNDELDLKEDQIVYVIKMNNDGWYEGVIDGVTGLFPGNYVEDI